MAEYQISLPEKEYQILLAVAQTQAMTPAEWIVAQLPTETTQAMPLAQRVADLVGAINSQAEASPNQQKTDFGAGFAAKLAKQGIRCP